MPAPLILALDVGTSSTRSALFRADGRRLEETTSHQSYSLNVGRDGTAELSVDVLEKAVLRAIRGTLSAKKKDTTLRGRTIVAVGMSCFWHSLLGYNSKSGRTTPIYTWGDARCESDAGRLRRDNDETKYHTQTGCMLRTSYWPAKLRWLHRTGQAVGITQWMSPADWLYGRICGTYTASISMASGTGLMNRKKFAWDRSLLRLGGISERPLPAIGDKPLRVQDGSAACMPALHRFPELADALWFPALGDGACSNLGSDAVTARRAAINIGTSGAVRLVQKTKPRQLALGLFCYQIDAQRALVGGAVSNAGNLRSWAMKSLRLSEDPVEIERALAMRNMPNHGLTVVPFWTGERAPSWPIERSGTIMGLTYATTALDLLQALTEATYHRLAQIVDELAPPRGPFEIIVSGGVRHSREALQRVANVLGRPVRACTEPEASLAGAGIYVAERLGNSIRPLRPGRVIRPRPVSAQAYAVARAAQIALEKKMEG